MRTNRQYRRWLKHRNQGLMPWAAKDPSFQEAVEKRLALDLKRLQLKEAGKMPFGEGQWIQPASKSHSTPSLVLKIKLMEPGEFGFQWRWHMASVRGWAVASKDGEFRETDMCYHISEETPNTVGYAWFNASCNVGGVDQWIPLGRKPTPQEIAKWQASHAPKQEVKPEKKAKVKKEKPAPKSVFDQLNEGVCCGTLTVNKISQPINLFGKLYVPTSLCCSGNEAKNQDGSFGMTRVHTPEEWQDGKTHSYGDVPSSEDAFGKPGKAFYRGQAVKYGKTPYVLGDTRQMIFEGGTGRWENESKKPKKCIELPDNKSHIDTFIPGLVIVYIPAQVMAIIKEAVGEWVWAVQAYGGEVEWAMEDLRLATKEEEKAFFELQAQVEKDAKPRCCKCKARGIPNGSRCRCRCHDAYEGDY